MFLIRGSLFFLTFLLLQIHEMPFEIFKETHLYRLKAEENEQ